MSTQTLISTEAAAERLGTTTPHIRKMAREGRLPAIRIGGIFRFDSEEIDAWLERQRVAPREASRG